MCHCILTDILTSCICSPPLYVSFVNNTSSQITVCYSTRNLNTESHTLYYDTTSFIIKANSTAEECFRSTYNNSRKKLSKCVTFFRFKTSDNLVCFDGPKEVIKIFNKEKRFVITDSLFINKERFTVGKLSEE